MDGRAERLQLVAQQQTNGQVDLIFHRAGARAAGAAGDLLFRAGITRSDRLRRGVIDVLMPRIDSDDGPQQRRFRRGLRRWDGSGAGSGRQQLHHRRNGFWRLGSMHGGVGGFFTGAAKRQSEGCADDE